MFPKSCSCFWSVWQLSERLAEKFAFVSLLPWNFLWSWNNLLDSIYWTFSRQIHQTQLPETRDNKGTTPHKLKKKKNNWEEGDRGRRYMGKKGVCRAPTFTREFRKPCTWLGLDICSKITWEDHKLSLLDKLHALCKQKVKAKAEI